jgi:hypothetical protein
MQRGGYRFERNELTYWEWMDLGELDAAMPNRQEQLLKTVITLLTR